MYFYICFFILTLIFFIRFDIKKFDAIHFRLKNEECL